jgi:AcrR family transcriptional regulator
MKMSHCDIRYHSRMARWEPGARGRLERAAFELFRERGFEQTTVTDIAARAGLDKRTFYRLFGDKREALFSGGQHVSEVMTEALDRTPSVADAPFAAVIAGFRHVAEEIFADLLDQARTRQSIIESSSDLMERESLKSGLLTRAVTEALRARGVSETAAALAAESGSTVFRFAFARWIEPGNEVPLADLIATVAAELRTVTTA